METSKNDNWKENHKQAMQLQQKQKQSLQIISRQRSFPPPPKKSNDHMIIKTTQPRDQELKLAALAITLNVRLRSSDMPISMLERAFRYTRSLLLQASAAATAPSSTASHRPSPTLLARSLKREFDSLYGSAWHCVVGKSFGSFVTHSPGGFVYFSLESFSFLLFKTEVHLVKD